MMKSSLRFEDPKGYFCLCTLYIAPLVLCIGLNFLPFLLSHFPNTTPYRGLILWAGDVVQKILLQPQTIICDLSGSIALDAESDGQSTTNSTSTTGPADSIPRRTIRKVDSLGSAVKAALLKAPPILCTIVAALQEVGIHTTLAFCAACLVLLVIGTIWATFLYPLCSETQERKAARDDALEASAENRGQRQREYTTSQWMRTRALMLWYLFQALILGVPASFVLPRYPAASTLFNRLAHQLSSLDDGCEKIAQSIPKASRILQAMRNAGGVVKHLEIASVRAAGFNPMRRQFQDAVERQVAATVREPVSETQVLLREDAPTGYGSQGAMTSTLPLSSYRPSRLKSWIRRAVRWRPEFRNVQQSLLSTFDFGIQGLIGLLEPQSFVTNWRRPPRKECLSGLWKSRSQAHDAGALYV